jgi:hypothetical protein
LADAEDVRRSFEIALRSDGFAAKLDQVWARKGETGEAPHLKEVYRSQRGQMPEAFPCIEVDLTMSRNTDNRNMLIHLQHEVHIFAHLRGDNELKLDDHVNRYLRAIREYFMENSYLPPITEPYEAEIGNPPMIFGDDQFSPFVPEDIYEGRPFLKSGLIVILVETLDNGNT